MDYLEYSIEIFVKIISNRLGLFYGVFDIQETVVYLVIIYPILPVTMFANHQGNLRLRHKFMRNYQKQVVFLV